MEQEKSIRRRGVYLLPNLLTSAALFAGFYSVIAGINGKFAPAAIAIIVAGLLDGLDGRVARLTKTQSDFGEQYDSLSDLISFGLAPALLAFNWSLSSLSDISVTAGKLGWLASFLFVACAALRLARFNTQAGIADKRYFQGLASPAAAGTLVFTIWFFVDNGVAGETVRWLIFFETVALGILMFTNVRYFSFKAGPDGDKVPSTWVFLAVLVIVLLALDPPIMGMIFGVTYTVSGLLITLIGRRNWKQQREKRPRGQGRPHKKTSDEAEAVVEDKDPKSPKTHG
ncbi:MAG: phosphatidylcholine/phosphatidylserine synthase [Gammaproteobacteria bacterium]|nr:phosphatidylcholine/phosphatidylserine synthase [Gammaproteobacteria bacterium]NNK98273.1 phosphatidylcholine/phosphatidylserine synthase [Xanthomonadales bacterium]